MNKPKLTPDVPEYERDRLVRAIIKDLQDRYQVIVTKMASQRKPQLGDPTIKAPEDNV
jgi:hypothetical protein